MCKIRIVGLDGASSAEFPSRGGHDFRAPRQARQTKKKGNLAETVFGCEPRHEHGAQNVYFYTFILFGLKEMTGCLHDLKQGCMSAMGNETCIKFAAQLAHTKLGLKYILRIKFI